MAALFLFLVLIHLLCDAYVTTHDDEDPSFFRLGNLSHGDSIEAGFVNSDVNSRAKSEILATARIGNRMTYFELCSRSHSLSTRYKWEGASMFILGILWATVLPFLEILVYLRPNRVTMNQKNTLCYGLIPRAYPTCHFPSGRTTTATFIWPSQGARLQGRRYYRSYVGVTTSQYHCPVPRNEFTGNEEIISFVLRDYRGVQIPLTLRRTTQTLVNISACSHPLYNYLRVDALFPDVIHEWVAYHKRIGFGHFHIYDEFGDFGVHLKPWIEYDNYVRYFPCFPDPANYTFRQACCCNEPMALDHCLFVNQLSSKWVMILHSFDMFLLVNKIYAPDVSSAIDRRLQDANLPMNKVSEIIVQNRPCGSTGRQQSNWTTIMRHVECLNPVRYYMTTPIFNPRNVRSTIIHRALLYTKHSRSLRAKPHTMMQTIHYADTRPGRVEDVLNETLQYPRRSVTTLRDMWPAVHADVVRVAGVREQRNTPRVMNISDLPRNMVDFLNRRYRRRR
jgi:hypothetical protein